MEFLPLRNFPIVKPGDNLPKLIVETVEKNNVSLEEGDIIVVCQSIVSKSEGRIVNLKKVKPSRLSVALAKKLGKDPREVEVILSESSEIIKIAHVIISRTKHGFVCANAGVDRSNAPPNCVTLLPENPDESAKKIRDFIRKKLGVNVGVIITDTQGRTFRLGCVGVAIGVAGVKVLDDLRGKKDIYGKKLVSTITSPADAIAAAAVLMMGEADEKTPVVIVRNAPQSVFGESKCIELVRPKEKDLFV
ncbi:MAG: coenzyme F420-0:L-glutamate ligase [Candidatus Hadarchaeales archaeon]